MPKNYWMVVQTPENHEITKGQGYTLYGLTSRQRRRARRMEPEDRILFYIGGKVRKWSAIASVTAPYFEDRTPIWKSNGSYDEVFPYRVKISPSIVLDESDYIDALILAPRLEYLKRWPPELWPLAFFDTLHLLPQNDFRLIESEMKRFRYDRRDRRRSKPRYGQAEPRRTVQTENDGFDNAIQENLHNDESIDPDIEDQPISIESDQSPSESSSDE